MTSKISLLKGGVIRYNLKRFWWVAAIHAFLLFLAVPYQVMLDKEYRLDWVVRYPGRVPEILLSNQIPMFLLLIGAAVILGICMLRYLQGVRSATLFHALPVKRGQLYLSALVSGVLLLAMPLVFNAVILLCMSLFGGFGELLPLAVIADWLGGQLLTGTAVLCFTLCVGVFTGSSVAQLVFVFAVCFVPLGIVGLCASLLDGWLYGYTYAGINDVIELMTQLTPIYYPQFLHYNPIWWIPVLAGIYILLFSAVGLLLYYRRHTERAGDVVAFSWIRPVFLYGVTFCVMLVGSTFITEVSGRNGAPNLLVMLLFALAGYAAAKMLLLKSFRILKYYKGFLVFAAVTLLCYALIHFNLPGFCTRVPEADSIQQVYAGTYYKYDWEDFPGAWYGNDRCAVLSEQPEVDMVRALHKELIDAGRPADEAQDGTATSIVLAYTLHSGREIVREYYGSWEQLYEIFDTAAAKDSMFPNFRLRPEKIRYIEVNPGTDGDTVIYGEEKEALVACVQADLERLSYEEITRAGVRRSKLESASGAMVEVQEIPATEAITYYSMEVGVITDAGDETGIWFEFNDNFTETLNWLNTNGYYDRTVTGMGR